MSDLPEIGPCLICGELADLYVSCGPFKTGPYCSTHRWQLQVHIERRKTMLIESKFIDWVDEFQLRKEAER